MIRTCASADSGIRLTQTSRIAGFDGARHIPWKRRTWMRASRVVRRKPLWRFHAARLPQSRLVTAIQSSSRQIRSFLRTARSASRIRRKERRRCCAALAGNWHHVYTGITVINTRSGRILRNVDKTRVHLVPMTEQEIDAYVATGEPRGQSRGYGIQGMGGMFVDRIDGSYSNVVGLPMSMLRIMLAQVGGVDERGVI